MRTREEIEESRSDWADERVIENPYEVNIARLSLEVLLDIRELLIKANEKHE